MPEDTPGIALRLKELLVNNYNIEADQVKNEAKFLEDLELDSLDTVELVMAMEEEFNLEIPDEVAEKLTTVGGALAHLEKYGK